MSIFCERRANENEIPTARLRRGWIGNILSDIIGFEIGSKRWLYDQARMTDSTVNGIVNEIQNGLDWFVEDDLLDEITATAINTTDVISVEVNLFRNSSRVDQQYFDAWRATGL
jgi:phage gp46-like protein